MNKLSQDNVNKNSKKRQLTVRLSNYRNIFVGMAYRVGLTLDEIAMIFGTTKQNVSLIIKINKKYENQKYKDLR